MKGILLAGGTGTRLWPVTKVVNKHLLPVYDRPMVFWPLATLDALGVTDALVISRPGDRGAFQALFGRIGPHGIRFQYAVQERPAGIAEALLIGEEFAKGESVALMLGDNLFLGAEPYLGGPLADGARVYVQEAPDVREYAVLERGADGHPTAIEEKPAGPRAGLAVTGLYLFDGRAASVAAQMAPSGRGELEIVDVLRWYLERGELDVRVLPPTVAWADLGTFDRLLDASLLIRRRQSPRVLAR